MHPHRQTFVVPVCLAVLSLVGAGSLFAGKDPILVSGQGTARLELAAGTNVSVPLPQGATLSSVAPLGDGWIAAGIVVGKFGTASVSRAEIEQERAHVVLQ